MSKEVSIEKRHKDSTINLALDTIGMNKQALIFANTKRSAEKTAEDISKELKGGEEEEKMAGEVLHALARPTKQCERLALCLRKGVAFHHAGLCLPPETEIILSNGKTKKIKEIVNEFKRGRKFRILTLDQKTLKIKEGHVSGVFVMNINEPLIKIKTRLGLFCCSSLRLHPGNIVVITPNTIGLKKLRNILIRILISPPKCFI